jgi:uncharacterized protein (TIGR00369 family)
LRRDNLRWVGASLSSARAGGRVSSAGPAGARRSIDAFMLAGCKASPVGHRRWELLMAEEITIERVQQLVTRAPYHQWLGLKVIALHDDGIELTATWREEWVVNPDRRYTHGGVLATLVDLGADWAMVSKTGRGVPTIDLRIDYHAVAMPGDLTIRGKIVRMGSQFSTSEARVFDAEGKLLASGRGTYYTAPPKA